MASGSDFVVLLLVFVTCTLHLEVVANDCEWESDSVIETSNCLGKHILNCSQPENKSMKKDGRLFVRY